MKYEILEGEARIISVSRDKCDFTEAVTDVAGKESGIAEVICTEGMAMLMISGEPLMLKEGDKVKVDFSHDVFEVMGEGTLAVMAIGREEETVPETAENVEYPPASFKDDFKDAFRIALTSFYGSRYIFRSLKNIWYDKELQDSIRRINQMALPFFILIAGAGIIIMLCTNKGLEMSTALIAAGIWAVIDILLITPLMYYSVLPKPVAPHIRSIETMTEEERLEIEAERRRNKKGEELMKRYDRDIKK